MPPVGRLRPWHQQVQFDLRGRRPRHPPQDAAGGQRHCRHLVRQSGDAERVEHRLFSQARP
jgi:hypothetical protein